MTSWTLTNLSIAYWTRITQSSWNWLQTCCASYMAVVLGSVTDTLPLCQTRTFTKCHVLVRRSNTVGPTTVVEYALDKYLKYAVLWSNHKTQYKLQYCTSGLCGLIFRPGHLFRDKRVRCQKLPPKPARLTVKRRHVTSAGDQTSARINTTFTDTRTLGPAAHLHITFLLQLLLVVWKQFEIISFGFLWHKHLFFIFLNI